jgi:hypothetical protein
MGAAENIGLLHIHRVEIDGTSLADTHHDRAGPDAIKGNDAAEAAGGCRRGGGVCEFRKKVGNFVVVK